MGVGVTSSLDFKAVAGGMFEASQQFGLLTGISVKSYWIGVGFSWRYGQPASDRNPKSPGLKSLFENRHGGTGVSFARPRCRLGVDADVDVICFSVRGRSDSRRVSHGFTREGLRTR